MMKKYVITPIFMFLIMGLLWVTSSEAVTVHNLYETTLTVNTQSAAERHRVAGDALRAVLEKVSGLHPLPANALIDTRLQSAEAWVQAFNYQTPPGLSENTAYLLTLQFDPVSVNHLLSEAHLPIWGPHRPLLLIWLVAGNDPKTLTIAENGTDQPMVHALTEALRQRGIPFMLPMMDVSDLATVTPNVIESFSVPAIQAASKRYQSDALLMGRLTFSANTVTSQWKLILGQDQWSWDVSGNSVSEVSDNLANHIMQELSPRYSTMTNEAINTALKMTVTGIANKDELMQLMNYLQHMTAVRSVSIDEINDKMVRLNVNLQGSPQSFSQALLLWKRLSPVTTTSTEPSSWNYQWND